MNDTSISVSSNISFLSEETTEENNNHHQQEIIEKCTESKHNNKTHTRDFDQIHVRHHRIYIHIRFSHTRTH
jgi:hypothetical protein